MLQLCAEWCSNDSEGEYKGDTTMIVCITRQATWGKNLPINFWQNARQCQGEQAGKSSSCNGCPNQSLCASGEAKKKDPALADVQDRLAKVKRKILVLSGLGEVMWGDGVAEVFQTKRGIGYGAIQNQHLCLNFVEIYC